MSRSIRRPFHYIVCCGPIGKDRTRAARGVRRKQNHHLRKELKIQQGTDHSQDEYAAYDRFLLPDIYECHWNNRYSWSCDSSRAHLAKPTLSSRDRTQIGIFMNSDMKAVSKVLGGRGRNNRYWLNYYLERIGDCFQFWKKLQRK